jgi:hypothetical protein
MFLTWLQSGEQKQQRQVALVRILPSNQPQLFGIQCAAHIICSLTPTSSSSPSRINKRHASAVSFLYISLARILLSACRAARQNADWITVIRQMRFPHQSCSSGTIYSRFYWLWRKNQGIKSYGIFRQASEQWVKCLCLT